MHSVRSISRSGGFTTTELRPLSYRPDGAAKALGVSRDKVFQLLREGKLRSVKLGQTRIIPAEALAELLAEAEYMRPMPAIELTCLNASQGKEACPGYCLRDVACND